MANKNPKRKGYKQRVAAKIASALACGKLYNYNNLQMEKRRLEAGQVIQLLKYKHGTPLLIKEGDSYFIWSVLDAKNLTGVHEISILYKALRMLEAQGADFTPLRSADMDILQKHGIAGVLLMGTDASDRRSVAGERPGWAQDVPKKRTEIPLF